MICVLLQIEVSAHMRDIWGEGKVILGVRINSAYGSLGNKGNIQLTVED